MESEQFDYIVVGGGSAGCVLANRLSEDGSASVLLMEAGPVDNDPWIHLPIGYYRTIYNPKVSRSFEIEPDKGLGGRSIKWPRGRVLGGSSSINGLLYVRGQAADYDHWRQLGNEGWSYQDVLPFFKKAEDREGGGDEFHGEGGPLHVSNLTFRHPICDAYMEAAELEGIRRNPDYNGASQEGSGYYQLTVKNGRRWSAAVAYLRPAKARPNLKIMTEAPISRVLIEDGRAVGVAFEVDGQEREIRARREVVLSAGSINSPQILMLSGIGPAAHLKEHGIEPVRDLPGVGQNLQDHFQARIVIRCPQPITMNDLSRSYWQKFKAGLQWALTRKGPLTVGAGQLALFARTREELETPDVQFHVILFSADKPGEPLHPFPGYTVSVCQLRPESRGHLELRSNVPGDSPRIVANYLDAETDRQCIVDSLKLARRIMAREPMKPFFEEEFLPGPDCRTDEDFLKFARDYGGTIFHPTSTCKMGPDGDAMAVVDARLRVRGIKGLRVADCSIMPTVPSGNTNAPAIMVGEKAAAMILEDARGAA